ncbi:hypothetical protein PspLS_07957 [Pyricularia sp. CBS 133598]|nr:hypothetical protein PspLS_07957 [Pyricularia sp. CBS 133598]
MQCYHGWSRPSSPVDGKIAGVIVCYYCTVVRAPPKSCLDAFPACRLPHISRIETSKAKEGARQRGKSSVRSLRIPTFPDHKGRARVRGPHPVSRLRRRFWIRPIAPTNTQARPQQPTLHDSQPHQFHAIPDDINR